MDLVHNGDVKPAALFHRKNLHFSMSDWVLLVIGAAEMFNGVRGSEGGTLSAMKSMSN